MFYEFINGQLNELLLKLRINQSKLSFIKHVPSLSLGPPTVRVKTATVCPEGELTQQEGALPLLIRVDCEVEESEHSGSRLECDRD